MIDFIINCIMNLLNVFELHDLLTLGIGMSIGIVLAAIYSYGAFQIGICTRKIHPQPSSRPRR